ncbi:RNA polymerase sigma factor [Marinilabilia salmonicolor]|uniref:RNA polymerase sigma factor n=1 Tax=Marinilabilia salmonicolor TaxID=989 RepID=UPI00029A7EA4|nr:sigma-70 family RNA polymerase sigma factor [Marinilabilia salmonicolor]
MDWLSDEDIMLEVKQGNIDALSLLFKRHHKHLFNFFLQTGVEYHHSEDLTQQVFYRILKYKDSYREKAGFRKWMFTIARNIMRRHFETRKRHPEQELPAILLNISERQTIDSEEEERIKALYKALEKIPPQDRELISLSRFQGMKYEDIAEITGTTVGAIKVKMHRALKKLRDLYFEKADH